MNKLEIGTKVKEIFSGKICTIVADKENPLMPKEGSNLQPLYPIDNSDCILKPMDGGEYIYASYTHLDFV